MKLTTVHDGNFIMLRLDGTTVHGLWRERDRFGSLIYRSDTWSRSFRTLKEAKRFTAAKISLKNPGRGKFYLMLIGADKDWVIGQDAGRYDKHEQRMLFQTRENVRSFVKDHHDTFSRYTRSGALLMLNIDTAKAEQIHIGN